MVRFLDQFHLAQVPGTSGCSIKLSYQVQVTEVQVTEVQVTDMKVTVVQVTEVDPANSVSAENKLDEHCKNLVLIFVFLLNKQFVFFCVENKLKHVKSYTTAKSLSLEKAAFCLDWQLLPYLTDIDFVQVVTSLR